MKKSNTGWVYILKAVINNEVFYKDGFTKVSVKERQCGFNSERKVKSEIIFSEKVKNPSRIITNFKWYWHWDLNRRSFLESEMIKTIQEIIIKFKGKK
jgi:hypothetical protein